MTRTYRSRAVALLLLASALPLFGCDGPSGSGGGGFGCLPGSQVACACPGGGTGVQVCEATGLGLGPCSGCPDAGPTDAADEPDTSPGPCQAQCQGRACGDDGCGGSCGACTAGWSCDDGVCAPPDCVPQCAGKACGGDGCGGTCGTCQAEQVCNAGQCVASTCTPQCDARACGDDGCGGSCGTCGDGLTCNAEGQCIGQSVSPCGDIPIEGTCTGPSQLAICVVPTGSGSTQVVTFECGAHEQCAMVDGGVACVPAPGHCSPGASECTGVSTGRLCDAQGVWQAFACPQCQNTAIGATCAGTVATVPYSARFAYEAVGPNPSLTDWNAQPFLAPAQGALVISLRLDAAGEAIPLDAAVTDGEGAFTIQVPANPTAQDAIVLMAARPTPDGQRLQFAVAVPDVPDGQVDIQDIFGVQAEPWLWTLPVAQLDPPGATYVVGVAQGSYALRVFDYVRYVNHAMGDLYGTPGLPLVVWLRPGTEWTCGACVWSAGIEVLSSPFANQMFIGGSWQDQPYWSDAVTAHELGHWVMNAYGRPPGEGGHHAMGCRSMPGLAWSEGFATWYSSLVRSSPVYYDKQQGTFFWFDIGARVYSSGSPLVPADPGAGLYQLLDENLVAAMLWSMTAVDAGQDLVAANASFFLALSSARMTVPPFARGYTTHIWETDGCEPIDWASTGYPAPMFADFLDAMVCLGHSGAEVDAATGDYPYASASALCW